MKTINLFFGALVIAAALIAPPAFAATLLAGSAGVLLMASAGLPAVLPAPVAAAPVVQVVKVVEPVRVFELANGGVVVFRTVDGKLVSRFYRA